MNEADESAFTDSGIPSQIAFHSIVGGFVIFTVWGRFARVIECAAKKDEIGFGQCVRDGIPGEIHVFLGSLAFLALSMTLRLNFVEIPSGIQLNFATAYALTIFWEAAISLSDPLRGAWFRGRIPEEWIEKARRGVYNNPDWYKLEAVSVPPSADNLSR